MKIIEWKPFENIIAGTTLKHGGVSKGSLESLNLALNVKDSIENVIENRKILADYLNTDFSHMISPTQTHSTNLKQVFLSDGGKGMYGLEDAIDDTDALYTKDEDLFLLSYHADCTPVLIYEKEKKIIASIHAGWKGNVNEIVLKTLRYLKQHENINPKNVYAYIGPCLSYDAFEAREDIINLVNQMEVNSKKYYHEVSNGIYRLDAKGLAKEQLLYFGVPEHQITINPHCTKSEPEDFFSYRNDKACGRHVSFISMKRTND